LNRIRFANITIVLLLLPALAHSFCFEEAGRLYGVSPRLLQGIARVESGLNPAAINRNRNGTVDLGLMQVNSFWLKTLGTSSRELVDKPCYNVMVGAWILSDCLDRHGKTWKAIGCYNATGHDKRVNYSWKIYRELQKVTRVAAARSDRSSSVSAQDGYIRTPPRPGDDETGVGLYGGINTYAAPLVSSIELTVTDKE
jgi:soluble lytic murein transglycosylase-like protein